MTRFERAYNALINAYHNDTLAKGTCTACAVGNIVADAQGLQIITTKLVTSNAYLYKVDNTILQWGLMFTTCGNIQRNNIKSYPGQAKLLKKLTGYSAEELALLEYAFEINTKINFLTYYTHSEQSILEDQFNGLEAVVNIMLQLENMVNTNHIDKLRKHPKLLQHG